MTPDSRQPVIDAATAFMKAEADAVAAASVSVNDQFVEIARLLASVTGKVVFTGAGTSGFLGRRAAHLFSVSGTPSFFLQPTDGLHGSIGSVGIDDIVIALSKGGVSGEVNGLARLAKQAGVAVIALTSRAGSELASIADHTVVIPADDISDPGGLIAMGSTLAYGSWLDAMAYVLMRAKRYGWDGVLFTHPGGLVGQVTDAPPALEPLTIPALEADR